MKINKCPNCGALLRTDRGSGAVHCEYCGYREEPLTVVEKTPETETHRITDEKKERSGFNRSRVFAAVLVIICLIVMLRNAAAEPVYKRKVPEGYHYSKRVINITGLNGITNISELIEGRTYFEDLLKEASADIEEKAKEAESAVLKEYKLVSVKLYGNNDGNLLFYTFEAVFENERGETDTSYLVTAFEDIVIRKPDTALEELIYSRPADDYVNVNGEYERHKDTGFSIGRIPGCMDLDHADRLMDKRADFCDYRLLDSREIGY
ncbi:MAG: zinc ribbon domain-containing protein [Lachnospiraceae bacterium]|nr:zinc ribbon domain-containing protein [Lachnospiraceae bacterium]